MLRPDHRLASCPVHHVPHFHLPRAHRGPAQPYLAIIPGPFANLCFCPIVDSSRFIKHIFLPPVLVVHVHQVLCIPKSTEQILSIFFLGPTFPLARSTEFIATEEGGGGDSSSLTGLLALRKDGEKEGWLWPGSFIGISEVGLFSRVGLYLLS